MPLFSEDDNKARAAAIAANEHDQVKRREGARTVFFGELPRKIDDLLAALRTSHRRGEDKPVGRVELTYLSTLDAYMRDPVQIEAIRSIILRRLTAMTGEINFVIEFEHQDELRGARHVLVVTLKPPLIPKPNQA